MDTILVALEQQQAELSGLLDGLQAADWSAPTRCEGWDVADVVLHLAQTDELAVGSATGGFAAVVNGLTGGVGQASSVDDGAARMVARQRGRPADELRARWSGGAARLIEVLDGMDLSTRVTWVAGELAARTLATTRLAETWIHTGDVAGAVGVTLPPGDRLRPIARLAWRTLPYAFTSAGRTMAGPVAFRLRSPGGEAWDFVPDGPALTTISGPAAELCAVAARRMDPAATSLRAEGPDGEAVLALVRTYA
ncbi:MAG TPA: maleylpyruvate isomerase family mycothiol-dependent enzyme [Acidimicrobiales bacterium]